MVRTDFFQSQVKRLSGFHNFEAFKDELLRVLREHCKSEEHAQRVVTTIVDTRKPADGAFVITCPAPSELIDYIAQIPANVTAPAGPREDCPNCYGTGWRIVEHQGATAATRCGCRKAAAA